MKQYCRYCAHLVTGNGIWCGAKERFYSESYAKHTNTCKLFEFNEIDAFGETKGYLARQPIAKVKTNNQIKIKVNLVEEVCPICGKTFIPAPCHIYRTSEYKHKGKPLCSYSCRLAYEREREEHRAKIMKEANEKRRLKRESKSALSNVSSAEEGNGAGDTEAMR